ncbi:hypothetical protein IMSAGC020_01350 [Lachnospiraceae bacterium]|nr:hypothetical protein IMSAGC020_01350 [Lachnospiraceae bacterium]
MDNKSAEIQKAKIVVDDIFNVFKALGIVNREALIDFLNMFDFFCSVTVERNFCYTAIENVVYNIVGFSKKCVSILCVLLSCCRDSMCIKTSTQPAAPVFMVFQGLCFIWGILLKKYENLSIYKKDKVKWKTNPIDFVGNVL